MSLTENRLKTADLYDIYGEKLQVCEPVFRHFGGHRNFQGRIATLKCFEDNALVRQELVGRLISSVMLRAPQRNQDKACFAENGRPFSRSATQY